MFFSGASPWSRGEVPQWQHLPWPQLRNVLAELQPRGPSRARQPCFIPDLETPTRNCLHRHRLFSLVHFTWISCLQGESAVKFPQQPEDPRGTASATGQILPPTLSSGTDTKGPREDFQCHHGRCQPVTSSQRTPKQWAGAGSTPKIVFTLPCPRGRLPEQRVPRCLLLDALYLTWQWAVPWQYPICSPLSRE